MASTELLTLCTVASSSFQNCITCPQHLGLQKLWRNMSNVFFFIYLSEEKFGPIILIALTAHHTPNLMSRSGLDVLFANYLPAIDVILSIYAAI